MSPNQLILLRVLLDGPRTTADLAKLKKADGSEFGENAARNALARLEKRDLVVGSGPGSARRWALTNLGIEEARRAPTESDDEPPADPPAPAAANGDEPDEDNKRGYIVLEEMDLWRCVSEHLPDALREQAETDLHPVVKDVLGQLENALGGNAVYEIVHRPDARNTEHALRQTAKAVYEDGGRAILVPVSKRHWQPEPVALTTNYSVSIG